MKIFGQGDPTVADLRWMSVSVVNYLSGAWLEKYGFLP
jgi:hypothetical protein